ncbi:MAG: CBS domain-containing protein [Anaerolineaceae bacterium]
MIKSCMKRNVISVQSIATIRDAALMMSARHIGLLPVVDQEKKIIGMVGLPDLLNLEMPAFFNLLNDVDFISDFGAVETTRPTAAQIDQPITDIMQPALSVSENCGLLVAYGLMIKHNLSDLPVISKNGTLVGIVSRVDIGSAILSSWKEIEG